MPRPAQTRYGLWIMAVITTLFPTHIYHADKAIPAPLNAALEVAALDLAESDGPGNKWCEKHGYAGYTSYGTQHNLADHHPVFKKLVKFIDAHAAAFAKAQHWDIGKRKPLCDSMWVNVLPEGGSHTGHIHTNSVISGTCYVKLPTGSGPLVFEDPRLAMMMAAPPRKASAPQEFKSQVAMLPAAGSLLLWESWLRHEVPLNRATGDRISVSFNYVIG